MPASKAQQAATAERRKKAIALKIAGLDYQAIADQLGYADRASAYKDIERALQKALKEEAQEVSALRTLTVQRYDRLQAAYWPKALQGDVKAAEVVLKILAQRSKIEGTEAPARLAVDAQVTETTQEDIELAALVREAKAKNAVEEAAIKGEASQ